MDGSATFFGFRGIDLEFALCLNVSKMIVLPVDWVLVVVEGEDEMSNL